MAQALSGHNSRIALVRDLQGKKGRREQHAFAFEGATLLEEAQRSNFPINELYVTQNAYDETPLLHELHSQGIPLYIIDERAFAKISDVETPTGILAVAPQRFASLAEILAKPGVALALADLNDPGNTGTLLRSADAFGATGAILGNLGADPYHPKVVRSAMGSLFRLPVTIADPNELEAAAQAAKTAIVGLDAAGTAIAPLADARSAILLAGHERHGLDRWRSICTEFAAIPMAGRAESLNAAVAGSIALFELTRR